MISRDVARELARNNPNTKRSILTNPLKNQNNRSIHSGSSEKTHRSMPVSTPFGKSTLEHVEFTDDLGVVYRIGFDPSGLINLTHLADVLGENAENFPATDDVAVFWWHFGYPHRSSTSVIITPVSRL